MPTSRSIVLGLTFLALVTPTAAAQDLRSPDTIDAARHQMQDYRSPDTRDAASRLGQNPMNPPTISTNTANEPPTSAPLDVDGSGTDWMTIALAAGGFALAVGLAWFATAFRGRRRVAV